jgi:hypothetical protein
MAAYLLGFILYFSLLSIPATMLKILMRLLFSTGFNSTVGRDDDFFNEPSTMRPRMTAAAAKDYYGFTDHVASPVSAASMYQVVARGLPGAKIHYAAMSA